MAFFLVAPVAQALPHSSLLSDSVSHLYRLAHGRLIQGNSLHETALWLVGELRGLSVHQSDVFVGCYRAPPLMRVCGVSNDIWNETAPISIDLGGNDVFHVPVGGSTYVSQTDRIAIHLDFSGDDSYLAKDLTSGAARGGGLGISFDYEGNDVYLSETRAQGFADAFSAGMLMDLRGDDHYSGVRAVQGAVSAYLFESTSGFASLDDHEGMDTYECWRICQGFVECCAGIQAAFRDFAGDDSYQCAEACRGGHAPILGMFSDFDGEDSYSIGPGQNDMVTPTFIDVDL